MGRNDGGLLIIDSKTAEIKFAKTMDRESIFIVNKTIIAEVLAIDGKRNISIIFRAMLFQLAFLYE